MTFRNIFPSSQSLGSHFLRHNSSHSTFTHHPPPTKHPTPSPRKMIRTSSRRQRTMKTMDSQHKRRATGGRVKPLTKKRKHCLGRPTAHTKLGQKSIHTVRCRGGNLKHRAMRLDAGNYSWGSESVSRKTRILDVMYNAK